MSAPSPVLVCSPRASLRLNRALDWLATVKPDEEVLVLGGSREAAPELVRKTGRASFGWRRLTFFRWAVLTAEPRLLADRRALASGLALEALWARVVFKLAEASRFRRYAPIADRPGLARSLARSVEELRLAGLTPAQLPEGDLATAWQAYLEELDELKVADRPLVLEAAREAVREAPRAGGPRILVLDVPLHHRAETELAAALCRWAKSIAVVAPSADTRSVEAWSTALGAVAQTLPPEGADSLARLQTHLFAAPGSAHALDASVQLLSAPGETRECVELARRVMAHARAGIPFDRMGVLLHTPATYRAPLEEALRRAGIPAHFASGTLAPDPSGRALLSLLTCADEGLSARRFAEYLSLNQVPKADEAGAPPQAWPAPQRFVAPEDEATPLPEDKRPPPASAEDEPVEEEAPVVAGALRAPRRWELLLVDAAVIGGLERWRKRLEGLRRKTEHELEVPDLSDGNRARLQRALDDLGSLTRFALPLLEELERLPKRASWAQWLEHLTSLATRALKAPERVLSVLHELAPMGIVGPVALREVRGVLSLRLLALTQPPAARRMGCLFVAPIEASFGLELDVAFVPGLAERLFPRKVREDPLLPDSARTALDASLETNATRVAKERLALLQAVGSASKSVVLSWPRLEVELARPRVPSFYALEALRAVEGVLPGFEEVQRRAEAAGGARLGWPAPPKASDAIDDSEYDLATLEGVLHHRADVSGRAAYLLQQNEHLARSLRTRFMRWTQTKWTPADGLVLQGEGPARQALAAHAFDRRSFSPTALEKYAACPYRFFLSAIHRLEPLRMPEAVEELGPLEKGSLTHEVLFRLLSQLRAEGVELRPAHLAQVYQRLDAVLGAVADEFQQEFEPAIERVWLDGVETTRADLRELLKRFAEDPDWAPFRFELAFGLKSRDLSDPASTPVPVLVEGGVQLRGSIDLVERSVRNTLRATDYKTGKARAQRDNVIGGGKYLQPALYALVLEKLLTGTPTDSGRLYYCTQTGGFQAVETRLDGATRDAVKKVFRVIAKSFERGFFPALPEERGCQFCDFRPVCGPEEERRVLRKLQNRDSSAQVRDLEDLRSEP